MELHEIISVSDTDEPGVYLAKVDLTDTAGERYTCDYVVRPDDNFGLAPVIRDAVSQWIADGKPVDPYTPPPPEETRASMPPLTSRQLRLALVMNGIALSDVESAIAVIEDAQQRAIAEIEWEYATRFERTHPLIDQLGEALGLTPEQIDDMWQEAANL